MKSPQENKNFFTWSVFLHIAVFLFLIASVNFTGTMPVFENAEKKTDLITAVVMNDVSEPLQPIKPSQPLTPPPVLKELTPKPKPDPKPEPKSKPEPKPVPMPPKPVPRPKVAEVKKPDIVIPDKKKQKPLQQDLIAKQLLADLKKQKDQQKKVKDKAKQKNIEAAFANELKELNAKSLQQQMRKEQQRLASERAQQAQGIVDKYKALILQAISQQWVLPPTVDKKRYAELLIRVAPGGAVLDVELIRGSGDVTLDRSARAAVFKASPLPVPKEPDAFDAFRQFTLKVKPETILGGDSWMG